MYSSLELGLSLVCDGLVVCHL